MLLGERSPANSKGNQCLITAVAIESLSSKHAKCHTVAVSNNRDHPTRSLYMSFILSARPICGELHIQHCAYLVVTTTSPPFYNELHWLQILFGWLHLVLPSHHSQSTIFNRKAKWQARKVAHCGNK